MSVDLSSHGLPAEFSLFGEDASRVVISCDRIHLSGIQQVAVKYGLSPEVIGETVPEQVKMKLDGRVVVSASVAELREAYEGALEKALRSEAVAAD
jgi:hypothetical protein